MRQIGGQIGGGRYTLVRELGRGGMGVVWLADDTVLGRAVAVKELMVPDGIPVSERAVYQERVLREARIAGRLANPGVVTVYDLIKDENQTYIVMEFVQAPTLSELIERDGPMPAAQAARLAGQLLSALEAAHDAGIVHRDVKPGNVMVPAKDSAKLTDFGIAQSFEDPRLTSTGTLIGSPAYMSPERLEGGDVSPAWDLWALGATLFFAVEGHPAYLRSTTSATMLAVMTERPAPRLVQGPLTDLIFGLLEPDPERRLRIPAARRLVELALGYSPGPDVPTIRATPVPAPPAPKMSRTPIYATLAAVLAIAVFTTVVILSVHNSGTPGALLKTTPPTTPTTTTTTVRTTSKAMQPVLTYGPGGDIAEMDGVMFAGHCLTWLPVKGGPAPDMDSDVGCFGPHDTEVLEQGWADREMEKDKPYPPFEALVTETAAFCTGIFLSPTVTGADKEEKLRYWVVVPNAEAWKVKTANGYRSSDRLTYCFVGKADGSKLTEPVMARS